MGYDQYTVPDTVAVEPTFVAFFQLPQTYVRGLSYPFFKLLWTTVNSKPPTIPFGIVACTISDNFSRNNCMQSLFRALGYFNSSFNVLLKDRETKKVSYYLLMVPHVCYFEFASESIYLLLQARRNEKICFQNIDAGCSPRYVTNLTYKLRLSCTNI